MRFIRHSLGAGLLIITLLGCATITIGPSPVETPPVGVPATPATPAPQPTGAGGVVIIEGVIEVINVNIITLVGGTQIQIDINNPLLAVIEVGDTISVEGTPIIVNNVVIINVITIISIHKAIIIIDDGYPLPPGCKITKKGTIKCTKKSKK